VGSRASARATSTETVDANSSARESGLAPHNTGGMRCSSVMPAQGAYACVAEKRASNGRARSTTERTRACKGSGPGLADFEHDRRAAQRDANLIHESVWTTDPRERTSNGPRRISLH